MVYSNEVEPDLCEEPVPLFLQSVLAGAGGAGRLSARHALRIQYLRMRLTSLPWMRTRSGPKMRVS